MPAAARSFTAELRSAGGARRFLRDTVHEWGAKGYDFGAPMVVTELATNAILHARTPYEVRLSLDSRRLVIEVVDASARLPRRRHYEMDAGTGRGLNLVAVLSEEWGVTPTSAGKIVWAAVRTDDSATLARYRRWTG